MRPAFCYWHGVLLAQPLIHGDETAVLVLQEDGRSAQSQSYMWVYRSAESSATPMVLFEYQAGRGQQHPQAFLQGYAGTLMTDGYSAWRTPDGVLHLGCFAHARRYFDEAAKAQGKADGRARQALDMIGRLYQVEALAKGELPAAAVPNTPSPCGNNIACRCWRYSRPGWMNTLKKSCQRVFWERRLPMRATNGFTCIATSTTAVHRGTRSATNH